MSLKPAAKFDSAFLEQRMREHREWAEREQARLASDIFVEIVVPCVDRMQRLEDTMRRNGMRSALRDPMQRTVVVRQ